MRSWLEHELPGLVGRELPADMMRQGIMGHSMGGHGALTIALREPSRFASVSAFAPIVSPMNCPWGEKALTGYLGPNRAQWRKYDACALIEDGARLPGLLVDQGTADGFLEAQLKPHLLEAACEKAKMPLTLRRQEGLRPLVFLHRQLHRRSSALARRTVGVRQGVRGPRPAWGADDGAGGAAFPSPQGRGRGGVCGYAIRPSNAPPCRYAEPHPALRATLP